jgi:hypothetical protein
LFKTKIDDHGGCQGDMVQILARLWHLVALSVAMELLHQAMLTSFHRALP